MEMICPNPDIVHLELNTWRQKRRGIENRVDSVLAARIKSCDRLMYPNLYILLIIGCTFPVSSSECERSFSLLSKLNTWLPSSMTTERVSSFAIMNIYHTKVVVCNKAISIFKNMHPRVLDMVIVTNYGEFSYNNVLMFPSSCYLPLITCYNCQTQVITPKILSVIRSVCLSINPTDNVLD